MRNLKRALSLMLSAALIIGMMVISAGAVSAYDNFTDQDEIDHTEAVETMVALNVIAGKEDGSYYDPAGTLTRAEMAKIVSYVMNGGVEPVLGTKVTPTYSDIDGHWAEAYIEYCTSMGIIAGDGAGKFNPEGTLTGSQTAKMFLTAMGYNANVFGFVGNNWEVNTNRYANEAGLYDELGDVNPADPISRDDAAQMAYNAIQATMMERTWSQNMETGQLTETYQPWVDGTGASATRHTLLTEKFDATMEYGYMTGVTYNEDRDEYTYDLTSADSFGGGAITVEGVGALDLTTDLDVSNLYGQKVKVIYKDDSRHTVYGIYAYESSVLASAVIGDLPDDLESGDTSMSVNSTTYRFDDDADATVLYNYLDGPSGKDMVGLSGMALEYGVDLIDNDDDGRVNCVIVYPFSVAKVSYVGTDSFNTAANSVMGVAANAGIKFDSVTVYEGIAKDDYVKIVDGDYTVDGKDAYTKIEDIVEGEITATADGSIEVGDASYSYDDTKATYNLGDNYKFVLVNGYICANDVITTGADLSEYAVVMAASAASGVYDNQVKLLFTDGSNEVVDAYADYSSGWQYELVTFEIEDGKYKLTKADGLTSGSNGDSGFDVEVAENVTNILSGSSYTAYNYASSGRSTIKGEFVADDAVVFVKNASNELDVISGSALKRYNSTSVSVVNNAFANKASNGFNNVVLAYVDVPNAVVKSTENYGYVVSGLGTVKNADNKTVSRLSLWTAEGLVKDILADENLSGKVAKGSVVTYEVNDDGSYTIDIASVNRAAILAYNADNGTIRFTDGSLTDNSSTNVNGLEVTSDTVVLYINSNSTSGVTGGGEEITTAVETATDNLYQANAYYFTSNNTELDVLIVDTYADLPAMPGTVTSEATTVAALQEELNSNANVVVDGKDITAGGNVTVPSGTKLTLTDVGTNALNVTVSEGATLDMSQVPDTATDDMLVATVKPGATFIYDNGALMGEGGYFDSTADVTIKNDGDCLKVTLAGTVTMKKSIVLGAGDTIDGTATIKGSNGLTITVRDASQITGTLSNFYDDTTDGTTDAMADGNVYAWNSFSVGDTNYEGWVKTN